MTEWMNEWCELQFSSSPAGALRQGAAETGVRSGHPECDHRDWRISRYQWSLWCHRDRGGVIARRIQWETGTGDWKSKTQPMQHVCDIFSHRRWCVQIKYILWPKIQNPQILSLQFRYDEEGALIFLSWNLVSTLVRVTWCSAAGLEFTECF